jgi:EcoRII C terminal/Restriction endonuclease EcoRII, N-terminal
MSLVDLNDWLDLNTVNGAVWYIKRLSGNDTLANGSHQAGPYTPKKLIFDVFPQLDTGKTENPDVWFNLYIDSHADHKKVRLVYYNGKRTTRGKTRNECRITNLGGGSSALLDPESTGVIAIFVFRPEENGEIAAYVWVCGHTTEEDLIEERLGVIVDPSRYVIWKPTENLAFIGLATAMSKHDPCDMQPADIPLAWLSKFPTGQEIIQKAVGLRKVTGMNPDKRIIARRKCEYLVFQAIERAFYTPRIVEPFASIEEFLSLAQTILQSRKSRSGHSLELHIREILSEENFVSEQDYSHSATIEGGKKPDFLFPSKAAYDNTAFPAHKLRMLGAKTTVKDRWRQIINEAGRIPIKHLLTLQEGVSSAQFKEMHEAGVRLVVPSDLHSSYPIDVRPHLISIESFLGDLRTLGQSP